MLWTRTDQNCIKKNMRHYWVVLRCFRFCFAPCVHTVFVSIVPFTLASSLLRLLWLRVILIRQVFNVGYGCVIFKVNTSWANKVLMWCRALVLLAIRSRNNVFISHQYSFCRRWPVASKICVFTYFFLLGCFYLLCLSY